jgi:hypothetical protein
MCADFLYCRRATSAGSSRRTSRPFACSTKVSCISASVLLSLLLYIVFLLLLRDLNRSSPATLPPPPSLIALSGSALPRDGNILVLRRICVISCIALVLVIMFKLVPISTLCRIMQTSKAFYRAARDPWLWRWFYERHFKDFTYRLAFCSPPTASLCFY